MAKELIFMSVQPDDNYFVWQLEAQIENMKASGYENEYHCLMFKPVERKEWNPNVEKLKEKYADSNIKFFFYEGNNIVRHDMDVSGYIPLLRPYCLEKHFTVYPELKDKAIFYFDSDVLFTMKSFWERFADDDVNYLSDTSGYLNLEYLEGKIEQAIPERRDELRELQPINTLAESLGISREIIKENNANTGGAQYILKNIDAAFWKDVYKAAIAIRVFLRSLNSKYFKSENEGWQSWCADMWAVLWNIWKRNGKTKCPSELDFAWASDPYEKIHEVALFHNAGIAATTTKLEGKETVVFFKGRYSNNRKSPHSEQEYLNAVTDKLASRFYVDNLLKVKNPIF